MIIMAQMRNIWDFRFPLGIEEQQQQPCTSTPAKTKQTPSFTIRSLTETTTGASNGRTNETKYYFSNFSNSLQYYSFFAAIFQCQRHCVRIYPQGSRRFGMWKLPSDCRWEKRPQHRSSATYYWFIIYLYHPPTHNDDLQMLQGTLAQLHAKQIQTVF